MDLVAIVAVSEGGVIGRHGQVPWEAPSDLRHFRRVTSGHAVIMGRITWESLKRPLKNRFVVVVTRQDPETVTVCNDIRDGAVAKSPLEAVLLAQRFGFSRVFVAGGENIYKTLLPLCTRALVTRVCVKTDGDTFFNDDWLEGMSLYQSRPIHSDKELPLILEEYRR